ncbi:MAG TPA: adenylate/guanylate cyclase domain-containing protein, partial [Fimbriimonadaceae bacterium]|nr:adenylate/guanylate cyclase domain-containing protein [Fimbriimonadaceae bacterium]
MLKSPVGTLTFLMTDIEGSTRLWEEYPAAMTRAIVRSEEIIHDVVTRHDGYHVVEQGEGDSTLSVFNDATAALLAAKDVRDELAIEKWPDGLVIRVRIGLHSGVADMRQQTYYGRV